jgi:hypothetical protein
MNTYATRRATGTLLVILFACIFPAIAEAHLGVGPHSHGGGAGTGIAPEAILSVLLAATAALLITLKVRNNRKP